MARVLLALALLALAVTGITAPREVLVVQRLEKPQGEHDPNFTIDSHVADELDQEGRVVPIVWSLSDPVFRAMIDEGRLPPFEPRPDDRRIWEVARTLRVGFVLIISAVWVDGQVHPAADLYRGSGGRSIWRFGPKDDRNLDNLVVMTGGRVDEDATARLRTQFGGRNLNAMTMTVFGPDGLPDLESTGRSIGRTWTRLLGDGPLRDFPARPRRTPATEPTTPTETTPAQGVAIQAPVDDSALAAADALVQDGHTDRAILLLRDAVDVAPFEPRRRLKLAELLARTGMAVEAAAEARRAARLATEGAGLWLMAARASLQAGQLDQAQSDLNEALARGAEGTDATMVRADLSLLRGDTEAAVEAYGEVLAGADRFEARIGRAIAHALLGDVRGSAADLDMIGDATPATVVAQYETAILLADAAVRSVAEELRNLPPLLRVTPGDRALVDRARALERRVKALTTLVARFPVPEKYVKSHEGRELAHMLLSQAATELLTFAETNDEDAGMESAVSLGEALKLLPNVRAQYAVERRGERQSAP